MTFAQRLQQEGLKDGKQKKAYEIVKHMLKQGMDVRLIEHMTGVAPVQIKLTQEPLIHKLLTNIAEQLRQEGWQEGLKEGKQKKVQEVVMNMLKHKSFDIRTIERLTGIPLEQIESIAAEKQL